jgi:2-keto-4-pentenoate hydratase
VSPRAALDAAPFAPGMARQLAALREALAAGMPRRGWKIGLNVPEVQRRLGLAHAGVGWLDGRRVVPSGALFPAPAGARLHVEAELALRLARAIPAGVGPDDALAAVAGVAPALELVDYARPASDLDDVVAGSMFHAACVLGPEQPPAVADAPGARPPLLRVDGAATPAPREDLVPAHLGEILALAADLLAAFGQGLAAGDLLLSGAFAERAVPLPPGSRAEADFGPLGRVGVRIAPSPRPRAGG